MSHQIARRCPWAVLFGLVLFTSIICAIEARRYQDKPHGLIFYFIGSRQSEIEPCGCKVNQLGGVQFEATLYDRVARKGAVRVDLGGWTAGIITAETSMRARYALRAMHGYLDLDAVNVSRVELEEGAEFFRTVEDEHEGVTARLISANVYLRSNPEELAFPPYRVVEKVMPDGTSVRVAIAGLTATTSPGLGQLSLRQPDTAADYTIADPNAALAAILPEMREKADLLVALFYGNWAETEALAAANPDLDVIATGVRPIDGRLFVPYGKTTIVSVHNSQGKELGWADFIPGRYGWKLADTPTWLRVDPVLPAVAEMESLIKEFKANTVDLLVPRPTTALKRAFASSRSCRTCHTAQWDQWQQTPHAHAMETLIQDGSQYDPSCLQCHTLGFKTDNGFYNVNQSAQMANVQCESCHGPSSEHADRENYIRNRSILSRTAEEQVEYYAMAKAAIPPAAVPESTCLQCHTADRDGTFDLDGDGEFDFERKHALIAHNVASVAQLPGAGAAQPPVEAATVNDLTSGAGQAAAKKQGNPVSNFFRRLFGKGGAG